MLGKATTTLQFTAVLSALILAYTAPFLELARGNYKGAPPYNPANPVAESR